MRARPNRGQRPAQRRSRRDGAAAGLPAKRRRRIDSLAPPTRCLARRASRQARIGQGPVRRAHGSGGGAPEGERPRCASGDERRSLLPASCLTAFRYAGGHGSDSRASEAAAGPPPPPPRTATEQTSGRAGCGHAATRPPLVFGAAEQEGVQGRFSVCHFFAWLD